MTNNEYMELFFVSRTGEESEPISEADVIEIAQLISGNIVLPLYESAKQADFDIEMVSQHLEYLYDTKNFFGLIYFIMMLADAAGFPLPVQFWDMTLNNNAIPILSAAIIEDWIEIDIAN